MALADPATPPPITTARMPTPSPKLDSLNIVSVNLDSVLADAGMMSRRLPYRRRQATADKRIGRRGQRAGPTVSRADGEPDSGRSAQWECGRPRRPRPRQP